MRGGEGAGDVLVRGQVLSKTGKSSDTVVVGTKHGVVSVDAITLGQGHENLDRLEENEIDQADVVAGKEVLLTEVFNHLG